MSKMIPATEVTISEIDGIVRASRAAGNTIGMDMEVGIQEDGLMGDGEIRVGEAVDGQLTARSEPQTAPRPWIGKRSSETAED